MAAAACPALPVPFAAAERTFAAMKTFLTSAEGEALSHSDLERSVETKARELVRHLLQSHLDARAPGRASEPVEVGVTRAPGALHTRALETIVGTVTVTRTGYEAEGQPSLHPLDAPLNLPPEKYSHEVRRRVALEAFYAARQAEARAAPDTGPILVLTIDGKGVVMRREGLRPATQQAAATPVHTFTARLGRSPRRHAKRMASVAAVYTVARFVRTPEEVLPPAGAPAPARAGPAPERKRVWASVVDGPEVVVPQVFAEAAARDPTHSTRWVALVDGHEPQIEALLAEATAHQVALPILIDFIHVAEYVWQASRALADEDPAARDAWVLPRLRAILHGQASAVAAGMRRRATRRGLAADVRAPVDTCADYLLKYAPYLRYQDALAEGVPMATGVIEGACRQLVEDRMNLTGARCGLAGAEAVLHLRAVRFSGDFDAYWRFHERAEQARHHAAQYADARIPATTRSRPAAPAARPHLKLVDTSDT